MSKTIKQIADELGVSKTAVRKKIENLGLRSSLQQNGNQFLIDESTESLIKSAFSGTHGDDSKTESVSGSREESETVTEIISVLREELSSKNKQIADLQEALERERQHSRSQADQMAQLADQAQKLQLAQMNNKQKRLLIKTNAASEAAVTVEEPKRGLFSWFRKG